MSNLSLYLPASRLFFGEVIECVSGDQSRFAGILAIKNYPAESASVMLDQLLHLDAEYIHTNSFAIGPFPVMQKKVWRQMIKLENASDPAVSQINQLSECRDNLASGNIALGYHQNNLMILADSIPKLKKAMNQAIRYYANAGIVAVAETIGLEPAFWSQIPGNQKYAVRPTLITSENFVDFCPMHNYPVGFSKGNHLGSAVSVIETPSKTPLFFNFHTKGSGSKNDLTPGHTTIIGGNGSGKTVFMGFMDAQMTRFGGRTFCFDRDRGMEIYIRATGGSYFNISPAGEEIKLNPFALKDTPQNRSFLKAWMGELIKRDTEKILPAEIQGILSECVDYAFEALDIKHRFLSNVVRILPVDFERWNELKRWLKASGSNAAGEYANLFDNPVDELTLNAPKVGFDLTEVLDMPEQVLVSVCMYLMHQVKSALDGSRVSIYFDEGWQILNNEYWKTQLKKDLPTLRKLNVHIVLATQSPASVVDSSLSAQFLDNCATNIFFCNPNANYEKHYQHFGVSEAEFEFIQKTPPELRLFLYKQPNFSAVCKLNLSHMKHVLAVFSGNKSSLKLAKNLVRTYGDDPEKWLPVFYRKVGALDG